MAYCTILSTGKKTVKARNLFFIKNVLKAEDKELQANWKMYMETPEVDGWS